MPGYIFKSLIQDVSEKYADNKLLYNTIEKRSLNYADSFILIEHVSKILKSSGFTKGDIVVNYCPLSFESVIMCWACLYNGLIFLPVDHNWPAALLEQIFTEASPRLVITDGERLSTVASIFNSENIILAGSSKQLQAKSFYDWLETDLDKEIASDEEPHSDDPAIILYTSGSTGIPKGVVLSQHALCNSGKLFSKHFDWQSTDVFMNLGDLHSMSGLRNTCITPLPQGSSMIIAQAEERNSILHIYELIHDLNIQYIGVAPTVIRQMNATFSEKRKGQLSSLKGVLCTGGPLAKDQLKLFYTNYNKPVFNYYGLTETCGLCSGHNAFTFSPDDNSIGIPIGAEFIILPEEAYNNPDIGELVVKSGHLMQGYYKREKETKEVLRDGCFYTGDIVRKKADGSYELMGRKKNTIKNLYSELIHLEEIDHALETHGMIEDASTCSYAPIAEDEKIIAFIVPKTYPVDSEVTFINGIKYHMHKLVGENRAPWCYYFVDNLPRNTMGKIERKKLREKLNEFIQSEHPRYF